MTAWSPKKYALFSKSLLHDITCHKLSIYEWSHRGQTSLFVVLTMPVFGWNLSGVIRVWFAHGSIYPNHLWSICFNKLRTIQSNYFNSCNGTKHSCTLKVNQVRGIKLHRPSFDMMYVDTWLHPKMMCSWYCIQKLYQFIYNTCIYTMNRNYITRCVVYV